jgi:hypothetical protein
VELTEADFYREQAARLRHLAARAVSLEITMQLVTIAQQFDRLADFVAKDVTITEAAD